MTIDLVEDFYGNEIALEVKYHRLQDEKIVLYLIVSG